MSARKKPDYLKKTKVIKIMVTQTEFQKYESAKNRLLHSSPPLRAFNILKYCVNQVDDYALIEFLRLDDNCALKTKLRNDYMMSLITNN